MFPASHSTTYRPKKVREKLQMQWKQCIMQYAVFQLQFIANKKHPF